MISRKNRTAIAVVVVAFALSSCADKKPVATEPAVPDSVPVSIVQVEEKRFSASGEYYGSVSAIESATLITPAGGRVESILVSDGKRVRKGESLGGISLEKAEAQHRTAVLNERIAGDSFQRQKDFFASGSAARIAMDQAELAWNGAKSALLQADEVLRGARCESPLDGTVLSRRIELYDELAPGSPTFSVGDLSKLSIEIGIPESDIGGIAVGAAALISFSAFPGEEFRGTLSMIDKELSSRTLSFRASIVMENSGERILPGVTAKVALPRRVMERALVVPSEALVNAADGPFALVARRENSAWIARKVRVKTGPSDAGSTVVVGGLSRGDFLIVEGNHLAEDGTTVSFDERLAFVSGVQGK
ncbi:MAG TPA: hypothetical protein DIC34_16630 [Treponema sp.]|nr:MAG: hypothetical protein A2Y36_09825 [Treponema sp. GWA1_62_8]OHE64880.1 MAG: hypothetical protein A2001_16335 [Treponema sp. GWC1_61_84]HCM28133.1 hypothetical protein [Treponema sp.]